MNAPVTRRRWNWRLWVGFGLSLVALPGFVFLFPASRNLVLSLLPSELLYAFVAWLLISGLTRAFREPLSYRGKISGPILTTLSIGILGLFAFTTYATFKAFPNARNAPRVGQLAPAFVLVDSSGQTVSLDRLLLTRIKDSAGTSHVAKGVLLVFYRGYW